MTKYWRFKEPLEEPPNVSAGVGAGDAACLRLPGGTLVWTSRDALEEVQAPLPEEPSAGAVVLDRDGDAWQRHNNLWSCATIEGFESSWKQLQDLQPLILMTPRSDVR